MPVNARIDPQGFNKIQKKLENLKRKYAQTEIEKRMWKCVISLKSEVQKVIHEYNTGVLDRDYIGFRFTGFDEEYANSLDHGALIDTGFYWANWEADVKTQLNKIVGIVGTNTEYAEYLETGTWSMEGFHVLSIAVDRCRNKIRRILKGELDLELGENITLNNNDFEVDL